jgi:hypothetical protein
LEEGNKVGKGFTRTGGGLKEKAFARKQEGYHLLLDQGGPPYVPYFQPADKMGSHPKVRKAPPRDR